MGTQHAGSKECSFAIEPKQQYAFHLRLTPQLLEALIRAGQGHEGVSIQFGATPTGNAITVGKSHFGFSAVGESGTCVLLRIPNGGAMASVAACVKQKLLVQRNLRDEKERVRARAEEAERERKERKTMVLSGKPLPGKGGQKTEKRVRSVTPPPRGTTPPPRPQSTKPMLTQSMLAPAQPQQRPPLPLSAAAVGVTAAAVPSANRPTLPPIASSPALVQGGTGMATSGGAAGNSCGAAAGSTAKQGASMKKSASTGKLGLGGKLGSSGNLVGAAGAPGTSGPVRASSGVVAACVKGGLRLALLALLAERPVTMQGVRSMLADVAYRVKHFKVPSDKAVIERALKSIAEFRAPGKYFLHEWLQQEGEDALALGDRNGALRELSPDSSEEPCEQPASRQTVSRGKQGGQPVGARSRQNALGGKRTRDSTPEPPPQPKVQKPATRKPDEASAGSFAKGKRSASQPALGAAVGAFTAAPAASTPPVASPVSLETVPSGITATTTTTSSGERGGPAGKTPFGRHPLEVAKAPAATATGGSGGRGGSGRKSGTLRSSSSRGSQEYDDSWIEQHAERQPEAAEPITSKEEYREREATFGRKYEVYFRLHQLIEANKKDFAALRDALDAASTQEEKQRRQAEIDKLWRKRGERAKRWDAAFGVLHAELAAAKQRLGDFVESFQRAQQAQPTGQGQLPQQQQGQHAAQVPVQ